ncbi:MAG: amidohydrolase family protein, partial [Planctomycetota bacterium]
RDADGVPTGVLLEQAALDAWNRLIPSSVDRAATVGGLRDLARFFVESHDLKAKPQIVGELPSLLDEAGVDMRVELYPLVQDLDDALARTTNDDRVRLAGGKIFVDGTLNSRTAWMLEPYTDGPTEHPAGMALMKPAAIEDAILRCASHGVRLACHAIGDGAVRAVLDAVERVRPPRWTVRIEHAEVIDAADVPRFAELGVIASVQPCHLLVDIEALGRALPDRVDRVLPLRELIDSGLEPGQTLLFGSDAPIVRPDPEDSIRAAVHRSRPDSVAIAPDQAISESEAWSCFDAGRQMPAIGEA